MDWQEGQRRLDHYNEWLMDPKRPLGSTYPGYPGDKDRAKKSGKKSKEINKLVRRKVTVAFGPKVSHNQNTEEMKGNMMTKVTNLSRAIEIVRVTPAKAEALDKLVAELGVKRPNAFVYFTKAQKALMGDAYPNLKPVKAPKAEKATKKANPVTGTSATKAKAKVAEIDAVIAGLKASGAAVASPFAGLGQ